MVRGFLIINMKNILILIIILILFAALLLIPEKIIEKKKSQELSKDEAGAALEGELYGKEKSKEIARNWILENSPTYKFDGFELEFKEINLLRCPFCYEFIFKFKSRQAGYGDRTGDILAQVITPHTIAVITEKGVVTHAITDEAYDEMEARFLDFFVDDSEQLANPASVYCVGQGGSLEIRTDVEGGQYGVCIFDDGSECEEWAFFREECNLGDSLK